VREHYSRVCYTLYRKGNEMKSRIRGKQMTENLKNVPQPICPINMYFKGDEDKCDLSKCDWDQENRCCTEACRIDKGCDICGKKADYYYECKCCRECIRKLLPSLDGQTIHNIIEEEIEDNSNKDMGDEYEDYT